MPKGAGCWVLGQDLNWGAPFLPPPTSSSSFSLWRATENQSQGTPGATGGACEGGVRQDSPESLAEC